MKVKIIRGLHNGRIGDITDIHNIADFLNDDYPDYGEIVVIINAIEYYIEKSYLESYYLYLQEYLKII